MTTLVTRRERKTTQSTCVWLALIGIWMKSEAIFLVGILCPPYGKCFLKYDEKKHGGERCCTTKKPSQTQKLKARLLCLGVFTLKMMVLRSHGASIARNHGIQRRPIGNYMVNQQTRSLSPNVMVGPIKPQLKILMSPLPTWKSFLHLGAIRAYV